ncbi:MAG: nitrile hydratase subunit beta [Pseudomonadota bacterium]
MDGVHDLGGREGFGPIEVDEFERNFNTDWEARMWGVNGAMAQDRSWTLDWWRHVRELIAPNDYLTRPYFDQWMQIYAALMVDSGIATVKELARGRSDGSRPDLDPPLKAEDVLEATRKTARFDRPVDRAPAFEVGDRVVTRSHGHSGHTRLPRYAMGRPGVIQASHGAHVFPDLKARGKKHAEPLYSVAFQAADLWPEAAGRRDRVFLDLWESYLER